MGEVLSQSETDNLLAALSSVELDTDQIAYSNEKQVKDYDFKRPTKFSLRSSPNSGNCRGTYAFVKKLYLIILLEA